MNSEKIIKTLGRDSSCDIVLDEPGVSAVHAHIELGDNGLVSIIDAGSADGIYLSRNHQWIKVKKMLLCSGDRVVFGQAEVPPGQLTAVFGENAHARLEQQPRPTHHGKHSTGTISQNPFMQKPRRNPLTGKIEEDRSTSPVSKHPLPGDQQK